MRVSDKGVRFVAGWEGFRSCPYQDVVGVWTIGYGETRNVGPKTPCIDQNEARKNLKHRLNADYLGPVLRGLRHDIKQQEADALASFAYNVGTGAFSTSTLRAKLNRKRSRLFTFRKRAYRQELPRWTNNGLEGLVKRRQAEIKIACKGDYSGRP
jgi:lysozyme